MNTTKEFSKEFKNDIVDLLELCLDNQTNNIIITMPCGEHDLDMEITFRIRPHFGVDKEQV